MRNHNEAFGPNTKLTESYDVITMFHVHYYWTEKERSAVMDKVFRHLNPGGMLLILILDKVC